MPTASVLASAAAPVEGAADVAARVAGLDWDAIAAALDKQGWAKTGPLLDPAECAALGALYTADAAFRSRVVMARHGYGQGEYRYFRYPLPETVAALRTAAYPHLARIANNWAEALGEAQRYPAEHAAFLRRCHDAGQRRPTPLLLKYGPGDYNRLHQDLYGALAFPLQMTVLLSRPDQDFAGGEFVLVEQKPRSQSRAAVVPLVQGEAAIFAVRHYPGRGARGFHRLTLRHGVSRLHGGERFTLGVIFHDAA
jgi:hypothetical protein